MAFIIDRRLNGKNKSLVNRKRFMKRYQKHIKEAVSEAVTRRKVTDIENGEKISIPKGDTSEPVFSHGQGGKTERVYPGNKEFVRGDQIQRPDGGSGGGSGNGDASNGGEGEDEFVFQISQSEFLEYLFEDLALPNMVKRHLMGSDQFDLKRAGVASVGNPAQVNIVRSMRSAYARRIALGGKARRRKKVIDLELSYLKPSSDAVKIQALEEELSKLITRLNKIPFLDEFDLKYNLQVKVPKPAPKAVMFCIMDVSGSMTQDIKETAKRFFILLYLFLKKNYEKIEVRFIRHHTLAQDVDEETFFYSRETGGTVVSSALSCVADILKEDYPSEEWNIYCAQASDGDNWMEDNDLCHQLMSTEILPLVQYYTYIEIGDRQPQGLWHAYDNLMNDFEQQFSIQRVRNNAEIYPVFRELFSKEEAE
ncbi:MAG: YeaH/YhbH family protein [Thiotrichaceae bacterium]|nr:YeaH/YhbH family protein [Thiotrichaceae bacterium]